MSLQENFINNLRRIRKDKKITQEKLAELCQTETSYIGQIEIGKRFPSINLIEKMAVALDVPPYVLFKENKSNLLTQEEIEMLGEKTSEFVIKELEKLFSEK